MANGAGGLLYPDGLLQAADALDEYEDADACWNEEEEGAEATMEVDLAWTLLAPLGDDDGGIEAEAWSTVNRVSRPQSQWAGGGGQLR